MNKNENQNELLNIQLEGLPPTVNHMYLSVRRRKFRSKECKEYQEYVSNKIIQQRAREWPYSGRVALSLVFTANNKKRWDIDNRVKALQDCLTMAGIIKDDSQIDDLHVQRIYGKIEQTQLILEKIE